LNNKGGGPTTGFMLVELTVEDTHSILRVNRNTEQRACYGSNLAKLEVCRSYHSGYEKKPLLYIK